MLREASRAYAHAIPALNNLKRFVRRFVPDYDKIIVNPRGVLSLRASEINPNGYCDSVFLNAKAVNCGRLMWINGTFTSYAAYPTGYAISFSGVMQVVYNGFAHVRMPRDSHIAYVGVELITGVGEPNQGLGICYPEVYFTPEGNAAWSITVIIDPLGIDSFPARVELEAYVIYDFILCSQVLDYAYLDPC
jgi:hypothetical protein